MTSALYAITDRLGWLFIEMADKTDHWGPFAYAYRLGNWFYGRRAVAEGRIARRPSRLAAFVRRVVG